MRFDDPVERLDQSRVKLCPRTTAEFLQRILAGERLFVGSHRGHGVKRIGNSDDRRVQGDILPSLTVGIPFPVEPFVMMQDRRYVFLKGRRPAQNGSAVFAMVCDLAIFLAVKRAVLQQDRVGRFSFPTSWNRLAISRSSNSWGGRPISSPIVRASLETRVE